MNVLIAEYDAVLRLMLQSMLTAWGYTVTSACDGEEVWKILCEPEHPHLVLLDWMMPGIEGPEIVRRLRERETDSPYYAIVMISRSNKDSAASALDIGADDFIEKPFDSDELRVRVAVGNRMNGLQKALARDINKLKHAEKAFLDSEDKYHTLFRYSPDAYLIIVDGIFVDCNLATEVMLRGNRDQIVGQPPQLLSPEFQPDGKKSSESAEEKINDALQSGRNTFEWVHRRLDGSTFFVEVSIASMMLDGKPALFTTWRDITERKRAEKSLERSEIKFRTLYDSTNDAVMLLDTEGFFDCNKATLELFGYATQKDFCLTHPGHLSPPRQSCGIDSLVLANQHIATAMENGSHRFEWIHRRADDGKDFPTEVLLSAMELDGKAVVQATIRDISARKLAEEKQFEFNRKLEALSSTDGLTGIANRRRFDEVLAKEYSRHARSGAELSLILLDIDYFKAFNDNYGHVNGDECLRQIAQVIAGCAARKPDLAARYGGEEFACILPETDINGAIAIAEKIRRGIIACAIPHKGSNIADCVTASLGVVTTRCAVDKTSLLILSRVDELLYRAKSFGRNRVEFAAPGHGALTSAGESNESLVQLVWRDSFCCGNQLIDSKHQSLFHLSNELFEAVLSGSISTEISSIITRLLDEICQHFHEEEAVLESVGFPGVDQHKMEHAKLLTKGLDLSQQFETSTLSVGDIFQFLVYEVVMLHMLGADREYFAFVGEEKS